MLEYTFFWDTRYFIDIVVLNSLVQFVVVILYAYLLLMIDMTFLFISMNIYMFLCVLDNIWTVTHTMSMGSVAQTFRQKEKKRQTPKQGNEKEGRSVDIFFLC